MNVEQLDGFFAALIAGPETVMPSEYYSKVFGGEMSDICEFPKAGCNDPRPPRPRVEIQAVLRRGGGELISGQNGDGLEAPERRSPMNGA
jgi:hypothetical protein